MHTTDLRASPTIAKRAVLIGTVLIIANSYWIAYVEMIWHTAHLTTVAMSVNVMFGILAMTLLNIGVRRIFPRIALEPRDLLVVYSMLAVGSAFSGHDCIPRLMGLIPYAFRFATPENDWEALLFHHLPEWLVVKHPKTVSDFYEGEVNFFTEGYVQYWIVPILAWSAVIFLLMLIFLCLTVLLRKQWIENEKLAYPIIQIPLEITTNRHIFRNRLLWIGFGIAMGINLLNGLQFFFPVLPEIPVRKYNLNIYFTQKPWNAMGSTPLRFHPYLIGFSFILPLDLAFSCTFFYLMKKVQLLFGSAAGIATLQGYPFLGEQGAGALLALLAIACWHARKHFASVLRQVVRPKRAEVTHRGTLISECRDNARGLSAAPRGFLYPWRDVVVGVRDLYRYLPYDCRRINPDARRIGPADTRYRLSHATVYDDLATRYTAFASGQPHDALADELAQRCKLRLFPNTPDARAT